MPVVIEFLGHAGSGKSYLASRLAESLGDQCVATESLRMGLRNVVKFAVANPGKLALISKYVLFCRQANARTFFKSLRRVLVYHVKLDMALGQKKRFVIIGEGALKVFNDIRTTSSRENLAYEDIPPSIRMKMFSYADVVVFVFSSLETVARRLALRENPAATVEEVEEHLARIQGNFHSSIRDNRSNIQAAMGDQIFTLIEIENGESGIIDVAIENLAAELLRM
jgi:cytidylate kinase